MFQKLLIYSLQKHRNVIEPRKKETTGNFRT